METTYALFGFMVFVFMLVGYQLGVWSARNRKSLFCFFWTGLLGLIGMFSVTLIFPIVTANYLGVDWTILLTAIPYFFAGFLLFIAPLIILSALMGRLIRTKIMKKNA